MARLDNQIGHKQVISDVKMVHSLAITKSIFSPQAIAKTTTRSRAATRVFASWRFIDVMTYSHGDSVYFSAFLSAATATGHGPARKENKIKHMRNFNILEAVTHAPTHTIRNYWRRAWKQLVNKRFNELESSLFRKKKQNKVKPCSQDTENLAVTESECPSTMTHLGDSYAIWK